MTSHRALCCASTRCLDTPANENEVDRVDRTILTAELAAAEAENQDGWKEGVTAHLRGRIAQAEAQTGGEPTEEALTLEDRVFFEPQLEELGLAGSTLSEADEEAAGSGSRSFVQAPDEPEPQTEPPEPEPEPELRHASSAQASLEALSTRIEQMEARVLHDAKTEQKLKSLKGELNKLEKDVVSLRGLTGEDSAPDQRQKSHNLHNRVAKMHNRVEEDLAAMESFTKIIRRKLRPERSEAAEIEQVRSCFAHLLTEQSIWHIEHLARCQADCVGTGPAVQAALERHLEQHFMEAVHIGRSRLPSSPSSAPKSDRIDAGERIRLHKSPPPSPPLDPVNAAEPAQMQVEWLEVQRMFSYGATPLKRAARLMDGSCSSLEPKPEPQPEPEEGVPLIHEGHPVRDGEGLQRATAGTYVHQPLDFVVNQLSASRPS